MTKPNKLVSPLLYDRSKKDLVWGLEFFFFYLSLSFLSMLEKEREQSRDHRVPAD